MSVSGVGKTASGLQGDEQADLTVHGGLSKAIYALPSEHLPWWQEQRQQRGASLFDDALTPGWLGENLSLQGVNEATLFIGDCLKFESVVLRVTQPREPCGKFNAVLGYEKGPISLRAAGTYRSKYLDEIGDAADSDRYVDNHFQLDLSAKLQLTDKIQVFGEWVNINNAKYFAYNNIGSQRNLLQYEEYDYTAKFGARVVF